MLLVGFELLDRQIVDLAGEAVGKVDDVELAVIDGVPHVAALLSGPQALGGRLGGRFGGWISAAVAHPEPLRIPWDLVASHDSAVKLTVRRELLATPRLETWLRDHVVGRIPGSSDAGE